MENAFTCPITLCEFSHPVIISCGHTFEKTAVENIITQYEEKSKCPICKKNICGYVTNWILVQALNLNIKNDAENIELQNEIETRIQTKIEKTVDNIVRMKLATMKLSMEKDFAAREAKIREDELEIRLAEREKTTKELRFKGNIICSETEKICRSIYINRHTRINDNDYSPRSNYYGSEPNSRSNY